MSLIMDHGTAAQFGVEGMLAGLQAKYPELGLYAVSVDWIENPEFICKLRGEFGDIVIGWS